MGMEEDEDDAVDGARFTQWLSAYREIIASRMQRSGESPAKVTPLRPAAARPR
jgi:hypothetical protein